LGQADFCSISWASDLGSGSFVAMMNLTCARASTHLMRDSVTVT